MYVWEEGATLLKAVEWATGYAFGDGASPSPMFYTAGDIYTVGADGTMQKVDFNPQTCLRVFGYGDLHFNQYNHNGDWPDY
jgi:hypothetical protein